MMFKQQYDKAEICINHAKYIAAKYGLNFNFDIDANNYIAVEEEEISAEEFSVASESESEGE